MGLFLEDLASSGCTCIGYKRPILPSWVANQNTGFSSPCPQVETALVDKRLWIHIFNYSQCNGFHHCVLVCLMLLLFIVIPHSQGEEICGSSLGTIENSETVALVVGLLVMFILVIYARSVILPFTSFFPTKIFVMLTSHFLLAIFWK